MRLFLDRHKTLLPRIDVIYLLTRVLILTSIVWYMQINGDGINFGNKLFIAVVSTYLCMLSVFILAVKGKFDIKLGYLSAIIYDLILVPLLIINTGGVDSSFYPLFYVVVSVATYVLTFWFSLSVIILITLGFGAAVAGTFNVDHIFSLSLQVGFIWVYYLAILYASDYMRKSETRLLKLFNTLNLRTSELEKSQAMLEVNYEHSRKLASLLDPDKVIEEIIRITGQTLRYESSSIIFKENSSYYYRGRYLNDQSNFHPKAISLAESELIDKVYSQEQEVIIKDITSREDFTPLNKKSRSIVIVPISSHGNTVGCLVVESVEKDKFKDRDIQILNAIARSAALALENAYLHKKTEELTIIDELTETYNYRFFVHKLQEEKRRASRYNLALSLIMVDIDWFKKLNDSYGHEAGNKVLKKLSGIIKECIRDVDFFVRYGGEEFAIILPQTPQRDASIIGERIRSEVEKYIFKTGKGELKITVSVGLSSYPENGHSEEELVSIADQALYRAKGEGRNLVCIK